MTEAARTETPDPVTTHALVAVVAVGALLTFGAALVGGLRPALAVAAGAATAALNLWLWGKIARALLLGEGGRTLIWVLVGLVKTSLLLGGFYVLVISGFADILPLAAGYGALPIGIVVAQLGASGKRREQ